MKQVVWAIILCIPFCEVGLRTLAQDSNAVAYAETPGGPALSSTESAQNPTQPQTTNPTTEDLDRWVMGPEIWRLPPVQPPALPTALNMPPVEVLPAPAPNSSDPPPVTNAPASLSGVLTTNAPIQIDPDDSEIEKLWDGSFDLGLDGSEGNTETFNFRFGFHANRKTESSVLTLGVDYNKSTAQTKPTENRLFFDGRMEWLIRDSRWSMFFHETVEYDEFQPFDVRDTSDAGLGYRLIKDERTTLIGRFGAGFSHEFGGVEDGEFTPEAVFGLQFEHQLSKRQKFLGSVDYAPDVTDFLRYRIRSQAALEVLLDSVRNLSLRIGVLDRYNTVPTGFRWNDLDYAMLLIWKF